MDVEVISNVGTFRDLESEWNAFADRYVTPLLRHEWFAAAFDAFGTDCGLAIHLVRAGGQIRAIAPFVIEPGLVSRLALLGHQALEPTGILHDDSEALQVVLRRLRSWRLPLFAPRLDRDSAEVRALTRGWPIHLPQRPRFGASVPLGSNWPAFEAQMSKQSRTYIRRKRKAAEREGAIRFEAVAPLEPEVERHLAEFIRVEGASWKGREGTSLQFDVRRRHFYTRYAQAAARKGMLRIFFLHLGQHTVAARMAVEHGGRLWELKIGYDERFSRCSPGILLTHETLRWACERGLSAHEFLGSAEAWQRWWPLQPRYFQTIRVYPFSVSGCIAFAQDGGRMVARRLAVPLRAGIRRALRTAPQVRSSSEFTPNVAS